MRQMKITNPSSLNLLFPWIIWHGNPYQNSVYLTFDDGPHPVYTPQILEILNRYKAKGIFFCNGENSINHPGMIQSLHQQGHIIGNHGYTHKKLSLKSKKTVLQSIEETNKVIEKIIHQRPHFFRPPFGKFDFRFNSWLRSMEMQLMIWSLLTYDFCETNPERFIDRILQHLSPGAILVFHDNHHNTPFLIKTLPMVLDHIQKRGYDFEFWTNQEQP